MTDTTEFADADGQPDVSHGLQERIEQFLYTEAFLQDTHAYDDWEALWTDDAVYWVPANGEGGDPDTMMSVIYDNRSRIAMRVKQLKTGRRHTQMPRSNLVRTLANIQVTSIEGEDIHVRAAAMIYEVNLRGETIWGARLNYVLRQTDDGLRLARKKVILANNHKPIFTLSFLV